MVNKKLHKTDTEKIENKKAQRGGGWFFPRVFSKKAQFRLNFFPRFFSKKGSMAEYWFFPRVFSKKAQMKIQQMAFMLLAVFLFFVLIAMVVLSFKFSSLKSTASQLEKENTLRLVSRFSNSPEFACGNAFANFQTNCIDMDKIMVLKQNVEEYREFWNLKNIEIRKIYPDQYLNVECSMENYPNCGRINLISENAPGIGVSNFVSLCRIEDREPICELGKIILTYNEK